MQMHNQKIVESPIRRPVIGHIILGFSETLGTAWGSVLGRGVDLSSSLRLIQPHV